MGGAQGCHTACHTGAVNTCSALECNFDGVPIRDCDAASFRPSVLPRASRDSMSEVQENKSHGELVYHPDFRLLGPTWDDAVGNIVKPLYKPGSLIAMNRHVGTRSLTIEDVYTDTGEKLGHGAYGEVLTMAHHRTAARRAVKAVKKELLDRHGKKHCTRGFIYRELEVLRTLDHPHVVRLYESFDDDEHLYLVLELCRGGNLHERLMTHGGKMCEQEVAVLMKQMISAVQHLHLRGIVHRDVKPENWVFVNEDQDDTHVKLCDFGLACILGLASGVRTSKGVGTTAYMAPEARCGAPTVGFADRVDVWSLGVILHVMFAGRFPPSKLHQLGTESYFSPGRWAHVSGKGVDILQSMLSLEVSVRPSVGHLLRHSWLMDLDGRSVGDPLSCGHINVRHFKDMPYFSRLALVAVAREIDDSFSREARCLFSMLESQCDGLVTRSALMQVMLQQTKLGNVAKELVSVFDHVDIDGSRTIDWTEFLALTLCRVDTRAEVGRTLQIHYETTEDHLIRIEPSSDACLRAFALLCQGSEKITAETLHRLLCCNDKPQHTKRAANKDVTGLVLSRWKELDTAIQELDSRGFIDQESFVALVQGHRRGHQSISALHSDRWLGISFA